MAATVPAMSGFDWHGRPLVGSPNSETLSAASEHRRSRVKTSYLHCSVVQFVSTFRRMGRLPRSHWHPGPEAHGSAQPLQSEAPSPRTPEKALYVVSGRRWKIPYMVGCGLFRFRFPKWTSRKQVSINNSDCTARRHCEKAPVPLESAHAPTFAGRPYFVKETTPSVKDFPTRLRLGTPASRSVCPPAAMRNTTSTTSGTATRKRLAI